MGLGVSQAHRGQTVKLTTMTSRRQKATASFCLAGENAALNADAAALAAGA